MLPRVGRVNSSLRFTGAFLAGSSPGKVLLGDGRIKARRVGVSFSSPFFLRHFGSINILDNLGGFGFVLFGSVSFLCSSMEFSFFLLQVILR